MNFIRILRTLEVLMMILMTMAHIATAMTLVVNQEILL